MNLGRSVSASPNAIGGLAAASQAACARPDSGPAAPQSGTGRPGEHPSARDASAVQAWSPNLGSSVIPGVRGHVSTVHKVDSALCESTVLQERASSRPQFDTTIRSAVAAYRAGEYRRARRLARRATGLASNGTA